MDTTRGDGPSIQALTTIDELCRAQWNHQREQQLTTLDTLSDLFQTLLRVAQTTAEPQPSRRADFGDLIKTPKSKKKPLVSSRNIAGAAGAPKDPAARLLFPVSPKAAPSSANKKDKENALPSIQDVFMDEAPVSTKASAAPAAAVVPMEVEEKAELSMIGEGEEDEAAPVVEMEETDDVSTKATDMAEEERSSTAPSSTTTAVFDFAMPLKDVEANGLSSSLPPSSMPPKQQTKTPANSQATMSSLHHATSKTAPAAPVQRSTSPPPALSRSFSGAKVPSVASPTISVDQASLAGLAVSITASSAATAPSKATTGPVSRPSAINAGPGRLAFVGLPSSKKSLGLGLSVAGRPMLSGVLEAGAGASQGGASQGSQPSQASTSSSASTWTSAASVPQKRKSWVELNDGEDESDRQKRAVASLRSRLQSLTNKQSMGTALTGQPLLSVSTGASGAPPASSSSQLSAALPARSPASPRPPLLATKSFEAPPRAAPPASLAPSIKTPTSPAPSAPIVIPRSPVPDQAMNDATGAALVRRSSVNQIRQTFEKRVDSRLPSPVKYAMGTAPAPLPPKSPLRVAANAAPTRMPQSPRMQVQASLAAAASVSTTPKGSPPPTFPPTFAKGAVAHVGRSVMQELIEEEDEEEDELIFMNSKQKATLEYTGMSEGEKNLPSLPPHMDLMDTDDTDERSRDLIVEKGRGGMVTAMDSVVRVEAVVVPARPPAVAASKLVPSKSTMPGGFAGMELDDDESVEGRSARSSVAASQKSDRSTMLSQSTKTLQHKTSQSGLSSSHGAGNSSFLSKSQGSSSAAAKGAQVKSIQMAAAAARKEQLEKERKAAVREERERKHLAAQMKRDGVEDAAPPAKKPALSSSNGPSAATSSAPMAPSGSQQSSKLAKPPVKAKQPDAAPAQFKKPNPPAANSVRPPGQQPLRPTGSISAAAGAAGPSRPPTAQGQNRPPTAGGFRPVAPSAGGSGMVGVSFMSNQGRLVNGTTVGPSSSKMAPSASTSSLKQTSLKVVHPQPPKAKAPEPEPYIELPDIDSEYSDSDEETQTKKNNELPSWAQSPYLTKSLVDQQLVNPDLIFGEMPALEMEEIFKTKSSKFRARSSSANWAGADRLTQREELEYARRMGFR